MPRDTVRPILVAEDVPAGDGKTYRVFVDVDDQALRRVVPSAIARSIPNSIIALEAFRIRLEEQP
jgi:hypothetical protein